MIPPLPIIFCRDLRYESLEYTQALFWAKLRAQTSQRPSKKNIGLNRSKAISTVVAIVIMIIWGWVKTPVPSEPQNSW